MKRSRPGHSPSVAKASDRQGTPGWSQLEQSFFDAAPPDVAVTPPPAPTFDDLGPSLPERRRSRRDAPPRQTKAADIALRAARAGATVLTAAILTLVARTRPTLARARAWVRAALSRVLDELPGERPDGRAVLATVAAIVLLCSLSATVLGRGHAWRGSAAAPAPATIVGSGP
jgi:hypothetical protein